MILWDFLSAFGRQVTSIPKSIQNRKTENPYVKYLRTNNLNMTYGQQFRSRHMKILRHIRDLKQFAKNYWFIVIPLHGVLTVAYVSLFYLTSRKTLNALKWLNIDMHQSEDVQKAQLKYIPKVSKKTLEEIAITLILLKLSAPIRITSTIIGSKYLVNFLKRQQLIKCVMLREINNINKTSKE